MNTLIELWALFLPWTGWIGAALVIIGLHLVGNKNRNGFLVGAVSEVFWMLYAYHITSLELGLMGVLYAALYLRNYAKWCIDDYDR